MPKKTKTDYLQWILDAKKAYFIYKDNLQKNKSKMQEIEQEIESLIKDQ